MRSISLARQISLNKATLERTLQIKQRDQAKYQEQIATGRRINRASDDAIGFGRARRMEVLANRYDQYERAIVTSRSWVDYTQDTLDGLAELFTIAQEEGIQAATDTMSTEDRNAIASSLQNLFQEVLDKLNFRVGEEYLFAGTNTTVQPFALDFSPTADAAGVTYYGNNNGRARAVGPDLNLNINITGQRVLDTGNGYTITEAFQGLITAIQTDDSAQIQTALADLIGARDHLLNVATEAGSLANRLDLAEDHLNSTRIEIERQRSFHEDTDLAEALTHLERTQTNLQATLQMMSTLRQDSLLDFLR